MYTRKGEGGSGEWGGEGGVGRGEWGGGGAYLHDGIGGQHLLLHVSLGRGSAHGCKVPHGVLGTDSLTSSTLTTDNDRLVQVLPAGCKLY